MAEKRKSNLSVGRRKTSVARVAIKQGSGKIVINGRDAKEFFPVERMYATAVSPLQITGSLANTDVFVNVVGGGINGQAGAVRLGLARALQVANTTLRPNLKKAGFLTRDPRMVERKKYGKRKARRGTQFSKR